MWTTFIQHGKFRKVNDEQSEVGRLLFESKESWRNMKAIKKKVNNSQTSSNFQ